MLTVIKPSTARGNIKLVESGQQFKKKICQRGHFVQIPDEWFALDLPMSAKYLLMYMTKHHVDYNPKIDQIVEETKMSKRAVITALKVLKKHNVIDIEKDGNRNIYTFNDSSKWDLEGANSAPNKNLKVQDMHQQGANSAPSFSIDNTKNNIKHSTSKPASQLDAAIDAVSEMFTECGYKVQRLAIQFAVAGINRNLGYSYEEISEIVPLAGTYFFGQNHKNPPNSLTNWFRNHQRSPFKPQSTPKSKTKATESLADSWGAL